MSSLHIWFRPCVYELENRSEYHGTDYIPDMICAYYVSFSIQKYVYKSKIYLPHGAQEWEWNLRRLCSNEFVVGWSGDLTCTPSGVNCYTGLYARRRARKSLKTPQPVLSYYTIHLGYLQFIKWSNVKRLKLLEEVLNILPNCFLYRFYGKMKLLDPMIYKKRCMKAD